MIKGFKVLMTIILIFPTFLNGFCLKKIYKNSLEKIGKVNYMKTSELFQETSSTAKIQYNKKRKFLYITFLGRGKSNYHGIMHSNKTSNSELLTAFDKHGNYINNIGKPNSYEKGGIIKVSKLQVVGDTIYIFDDSNDRISVFNFCEEDGDFILDYIIDTNNILGSYSFFVKNHTLLGSKPPGFLKENNNTAFIANIVNDTNYKNAKYIKLMKTIFPCTEYRKMLAFDYKKEFKEAGYDVEKKNSENPNLKYIWEVVGTGGVYSTVIYENNNDTLYACNTFGSDIIKFDSNLNIIDSIRVEKFHQFRNEEINTYKNIENRKASFNNRYSKLIDLFFNSSHDWLILYYKLTPTMAKISGFDKCIFIYSENRNKFLVNFYPVNFIPIDSFKDKIIGLKFEEGKPCLIYYQIKI